MDEEEDGWSKAQPKTFYSDRMSNPVERWTGYTACCS